MMDNRQNDVLPPDEEVRKSGLFRFMDHLDRNGLMFVWTGFLSLLALLPFLGGVVLAWQNRSLLVLLIGGVLGGGIAAPFLCGLMDVLLCSMRDKSLFLWQRYRTSVRRNWKASLPFGILYGTVFALQIFMLLYLPYSNTGLGLLLCQIVSMFVFSALLLHSIPQIVLMNLPAIAIVKNSVLMSIRYFSKTLLAVLIQLIYWGAMWFFFPVTSIVILLTSLWLPALLGLTVLYPTLDEAFQIEERLHES